MVSALPARNGTRTITNHLFVYGTLMRNAADAPMGHLQRGKLDAAAEWLGQAQIDGRLYDRGCYPILVMGGSGRETVYGEVYRLRSPVMTFQWLDPYEGIPPGKTRGPEYERIVGKVRLEGGSEIDVWVYAHHGSLGAARHVLEGRWRPA